MRRVLEGSSDAVLPGGVQVVAGRIHSEPIAAVRPNLDDRAFDHLGDVAVIVGVQVVELDDAPPAAQYDDLELRQDARVRISVCGVNRCRPAWRAGRAVAVPPFRCRLLLEPRWLDSRALASTTGCCRLCPPQLPPVRLSLGAGPPTFCRRAGIEK